MWIPFGQFEHFLNLVPDALIQPILCVPIHLVGLDSSHATLQEDPAALLGYPTIRLGHSAQQNVDNLVNILYLN